jgi:FkbM family methyltransferase
MALANSFGIAKFNIGRGVEMSSLFDDNTENVIVPKEIADSQGLKSQQMNDYGYTPSVVGCDSVDNWSEDNGVKIIDFFWLDAEGAELLILKGASMILPTVKVILSELNFQQFRKGAAMFDDVYGYLTEKGFELKHIWGRSNWQAMGIFVRRM